MELSPIPNANRIVSATVVCGAGGKWRGVVGKDQFEVGDKCCVYLPDSIIPECSELSFMSSTKWRVKMRNFRGAPSEVVIVRYEGDDIVGKDITELAGVKRYIKAVPANLAGIAKGDFPSFIRKTDEPNWQRVPELVELLEGNPYYITEKADGSSTTAYQWGEGDFGVCSRNLELVESESNGYWKIANKYNLRKRLPHGYALQWETCGPGIQKNPMGFTELTGLAFSLYDITAQEYCEVSDLLHLCQQINFPVVPILESGHFFECKDLSLKAKGKYCSGQIREGIVVRSSVHINEKPVSFKVINLDYED